MSTTQTRMRFATLGGAAVTVTHHTGGSQYLNHTWQCAGCLAGTRPDEQVNERDARNDANDHAGQCRALPPVDDE